MKNVCLISIWWLCLTAPGLAQAPQIVSITPSQNELNVPIDTDISVTFDIDMNDATINGSTFVVHALTTGLHEGEISYDAPSRTAILDPAHDFAEGRSLQWY